MNISDKCKTLLKDIRLSVCEHCDEIWKTKTLIAKRGEEKNFKQQQI